MNPLDPISTAVLVAATVMLLVALWLRRRQRTPRVANPADESLDTVQAWPPQAVRVMTLGERKAYEIVRRALPQHLILAQVPLSRFISVPTRYPYSQWLTRAGRLGVDLLVCDFSSRAIAAIEVRTPDESVRGAKRHARLVQVLRAAGITVHEWNEEDLPGISEVRDLFAGKATNPTPVDQPAAETDAPCDARGRRLIPVPEIQELLAEGDANDYGHLEPVPSGFFEDADTPAARRAA